MTFAVQDIGYTADRPLISGDTIPFVISVFVNTKQHLILMSADDARWQMFGLPPMPCCERDPIVKKSLATTGVTRVDAGTQQVDFQVCLEPSDTEHLSPGDYYHELEVLGPGTNVQTTTTGRFKLTADGIL